MTVKKPDDERRDRRIASYVTAGEQAALVILGTNAYGYHGTADVIRQGLAMLISARHPELRKHLRADIVNFPPPSPLTGQ